MSNTCGKIVEDEDMSDWAYDAVAKIKGLLNRGKRWPDEMNHPNDAKNRIGWKWSNLMYKLNIRKFKKYRPQSSLTRDPYTELVYCAAFLNYWWIIKTLSMPWWLRKPPLFRVWIRYMKTGKGLRLFTFLDRIDIIPKPDFVNRLNEHRRLAVELKKKSNGTT